MSIYRRVLRYYQPFWGQTILGLLLSLIGIGLNLLKPWPFKIIVDDFLRPTPAARGDWRTWVPLLCLGLVVIQFVWGIINWITNYLFVKIGLQALLKLRTDLYAHLQRLSLKFHDARRSADSSFRVAYDSQAIQTIYNKGFTNIFASVVALIGTFFVMLRLDWVARPCTRRRMSATSFSSGSTARRFSNRCSSWVTSAWNCGSRRCLRMGNTWRGTSGAGVARTRWRCGR